jgi:hypothetical protein
MLRNGIEEEEREREREREREGGREGGRRERERERERERKKGQEEREREERCRAPFVAYTIRRAMTRDSLSTDESRWAMTRTSPTAIRFPLFAQSRLHR